MKGPITQAMLDVGIIDKDAMGQLQNWGLMSRELEDPAHEFANADEAYQHIMEAVESGEAVETRDTDFTVLKQYLATKVKGKLHVPNPDDKGTTVGIPVYYGRTKMGDVIMPYLEETIMDMLLDGQTYLKPVGQEKLFFRDTRTLFYDEHPAFVVCEMMEDIK